MNMLTTTGITTKESIRVAFTDFWPELDWRGTEPVRLLAEHYDFQESPDPELLFFSVYGTKHMGFTCHKVMLTVENVTPTFRFCDFAFSFAPTDARNFQLPSFALAYPWWRPEALRMDLRPLQEHPKTRFCNFVYSNPSATERIEFCARLQEQRAVDCPGAVLNNMPGLEAEGPREGLWPMVKRDFIRNYRFTIAFENESAEHYTTEKLIDPLLAGSIPIYWGNPKVSDYFNPACFINCHDFPSFDAAIEHVLEVEASPQLQDAYRSAPWFLPESKAHAITEDAILERFREILARVRTTKPVSKTPRHYADRGKRRLGQVRRWARGTPPNRFGNTE